MKGLPPHGVVVARVDRNGPAAQAGIKAATHPVTVNGASALLGGDAIVAVDGKPIHSSTQLADAIASRKPGDRVSLETVRGGSTRQVAARSAARRLRSSERGSFPDGADSDSALAHPPAGAPAS